MFLDVVIDIHQGLAIKTISGRVVNMIMVLHTDAPLYIRRLFAVDSPHKEKVTIKRRLEIYPQTSLKRLHFMRTDDQPHAARIFYIK